MALHVKATKYHKTVLGTQHAVYMRITKKHKGNAYKEKKRVRKREGRKKALSPRTATVEMEMQRKRVDTSCKN